MSDTRTKIIETMYELVSEKGYDKTSIGQICEVIGIKKPSVYYYFKNKEEIFLEVVEDVLNYVSQDDSDLYEISTAKEFKAYLTNFGITEITSFQQDIKAKKVAKEIYLQAERIAAVKTLVKKSDQEGREAFKVVIEQGKRVGALKPTIAMDTYIDLMSLLFEGMHTSIVSNQGNDVKASWVAFVDTFFQE